jgi:hypothetical protein
MKILRHRRLSTTLELYTHRSQDKQLGAQGMFIQDIKVANRKPREHRRVMPTSKPERKKR